MEEDIKETAKKIQAKATAPIILGYKAYYGKDLEPSVKENLRRKVKQEVDHFASLQGYSAGILWSFARMAARSFVADFRGVFGDLTANELAGMGKLEAKLLKLKSADDATADKEDKDPVKENDSGDPRFSAIETMTPKIKPQEDDAASSESSGESGAESGTDDDRKTREESKDKGKRKHEDENSMVLDSDSDSVDDKTSDSVDDESKPKRTNVKPDVPELERSKQPLDVKSNSSRVELAEAMRLVLGSEKLTMLTTAASWIEEKGSGSNGSDSILLDKGQLMLRTRRSASADVFSACESTCTNAKDGACLTRRCKNQAEMGIGQEIDLKVVLQTDVEDLNRAELYLDSSQLCSEFLARLLCTEAVVGDRCPNLPVMYAVFSCNASDKLLRSLTDYTVTSLKFNKFKFPDTLSKWGDEFRKFSGNWEMKNRDIESAKPETLRGLIDQRLDAFDASPAARASRAVPIRCVVFASEALYSGTAGAWLSALGTGDSVPDFKYEVLSMMVQVTAGVIAMHRLLGIMPASVTLDKVVRYELPDQGTPKNRFRLFEYDFGKEGKISVPVVSAIYVISELQGAAIATNGFDMKQTPKHAVPHYKTFEGERNVMSAVYQFGKQLTGALRDKKIPKKEYKEVSECANARNAHRNPIEALMNTCNNVKLESSVYSLEPEVIGRFDLDTPLSFSQNLSEVMGSIIRPY